MVNDRLATQLQETGFGSILGLSPADLYDTLSALGIDPGDAVLTGSRVIIKRRMRNTEEGVNITSVN